MTDVAVIELVGAACALVGTVCAGTVAHECTHAAVLAGFGVPYEIEWFPRTRGFAGSRALASVTPRSIPAGLPRWRLRTAAIVPVVLTVPFWPVVVGLVPDPLRTGGPAVQAAAVGWLACAIPSPADFSLFWHAGEFVDGATADPERPDQDGR